MSCKECEYWSVTYEASKYEDKYDLGWCSLLKSSMYEGDACYEHIREEAEREQLSN